MVTMASLRWIFDEATLGFDEEDRGPRPPEPSGSVAAGPGRGRGPKDTQMFQDVVELSDEQHSWLKQAETKRGELALSAQDDADMVPLSWGGRLSVWHGRRRREQTLSSSSNSRSRSRASGLKRTEYWPNVSKDRWFASAGCQLCQQDMLPLT